MTFWEGVVLIVLSPMLLLIGWISYLALDALIMRIWEWWQQ
jgi:hypothetical protein